MPNNDIEVFDHLLSDEETAVEIDYLTYAIFGFRKRQWIDHFKSRNDGRPPSQAEIDSWISELTKRLLHERPVALHAVAGSMARCELR